MMPPREAARKPDAATRLALITALETTTRRGRRRATRGIGRSSGSIAPSTRRRFARCSDSTIDAGTYLPADTISASFDNIADAQTPSATVMQGYLRAAAHVSSVAVGDPSIDASSTQYQVPRTASQKHRVDGAPFGTRGGTVVTHNFPADGTYDFQLLLHGEPTGFLFGRTQREIQMEVAHRRRARRAAESRSLDVGSGSAGLDGVHRADQRAGRRASGGGDVHPGIRGLGRRS